MKKQILIGLLLTQIAFSSEQVVVSPYCWNNQDVKYTYYKTPADAVSFPSDTWYSHTNPSSNTFKPIWDLRYVNPSSPMWDAPNHSILTGLDTTHEGSAFGTSISRWNNEASIVQTKCVNGLVAGGTIVNLWDAPEQSLVQAGAQSTFSYQLENVFPWRYGKNLRIQANFDMPTYYKGAGNHGGNIAYLAYMYNPSTEKHYSYVISLFGYGDGVIKDGAGYTLDSNTVIGWAQAALNSTRDGVSFATRSPYSNGSFKLKPSTIHHPTRDDGKWPYFYRANISYNNLALALKSAGFKGADLKPENWQLTMVGIQYEIEETGGKGSISGSFLGFRADITDGPQ